MSGSETARIVVTGAGAICGAGNEPGEIWQAVRAGQSALAADERGKTAFLAAVSAFDAAALVPERKVHKLLQRSDFFGLYAARRAIEAAGIPAHRDALAPDAAATFNERTAVYVGSGGATYQSNYDFFPLLSAAGLDLSVFGRELTQVNPMWLLRTLPNNVLCHIGIRHGFKGANGCMTNHGAGGALACVEGAAALFAGMADRAIVVAHDSPIEPQTQLHYQAVGLLAEDAVRPFGARRGGTALGEGAAAIVLETDAAARARGVPIAGEFLGAGCVTEGESLLGVRADGDGLVRAIARALDHAGLNAARVGMIVAHGNGTLQSDASEAAALRRIFGSNVPPVTAFKWCIGHLTAAAAVLESVLALRALQEWQVPGIATLDEMDPDCADLSLSPLPQPPRTNVALVLSRGFAGMNVALLWRAGGM